MLLLAGTVAGAGAVVVVQERYLPPRLSPSASAQLRGALEQADGERLRLRDELSQAKRRLETVQSEKKAVADELALGRATTARLQEDLAAVVGSLPADPRGGAVEVRAGRFTAKGGLLNYNVVLTRQHASGKPMPGTLQLLVAGESERGTPTTVTAQPIPLSVGSHEVVRGSLPLPQGFKPRQTTIRVLDKVAGKPLGMRVLQVQ